jgi:hypothetical protein
MMTYIGIDPGKHGAVAVMYSDGSITVMPMHDRTMITVMRTLSGIPCRCCLEKVHAMPKQGVASTFTFGEGYGYVKGVLESFNISYQEIPPERWKKEFGLNTDKKKSIEVCRQLFPDVDLRPTERCRTDNDGMAEAVLMVEYARRKL